MEKSEKFSEKFKLVAVGLLSGAVNGLFGTGGGMLLVPLLRDWLHIDEKKTFALSVCVILPVCAAGLIVYMAKDGYNPLDAAEFSAGGIVGGITAGKLFGKVPVSLIGKAFGVLLILGGIRAAFF